MKDWRAALLSEDVPLAHIADEFEQDDPVHHPSHYTAHPSGVECIDIAEHYNFNLGNALKYIWRAGLKSDDPVEDLRKAAFYIDREIGRLEAER